jgi:hypothetical protein
MNITIEYDDEQLKRLMRQTPRRINAVARRIANYVSSDIHKNLSRSVPIEAGVNLGGFKRVRAFKRNTLLRKKRFKASVWLGGNRIGARYGGRMKNVEGGATAGRHFFAGGFKATMKSGYTSIFTRLSNGKLKQSTIEVPDLNRASIDFIRANRRDWERRLEIELDKIIK